MLTFRSASLSPVTAPQGTTAYWHVLTGPLRTARLGLSYTARYPNAPGSDLRSTSFHRPARPSLSCAAGGGAGSSGGVTGGGGAGGSGSSSSGGPHPMRLWTFVYAAVLAAGGMMGYVKKGSVKSLTSAGGAALILALTARTMSGPGARGAVFVGLAVSLLLTVAMSGRFRRTGKFMPAGLIAGVSLLMSAAYIGSLI
eukprot:jgi/Chrzof1/7924/Cz02g41140.t1